MEEHEDVLETDNTEAACGEKKHNVTSLAVPPCDIVSAGAPAVWRSLFRDAFPGILRWEGVCACVVRRIPGIVALGGGEKYRAQEVPKPVSRGPARRCPAES